MGRWCEIDFDLKIVIARERNVTLCGVFVWLNCRFVYISNVISFTAMVHQGRYLRGAPREGWRLHFDPHVTRTSRCSYLRPYWYRIGWSRYLIPASAAIDGHQWVNDYWCPVRPSYLPKPRWVPTVCRSNVLHDPYGLRIGPAQLVTAQKGEWLWYVTDPSVSELVSCPGWQETTGADHGFGPASTSLGRLV